MTEYFLLGLAAIIVLGVMAQWLSWRFKIPSILLLLIFGFLAGPVTGLLNPEELMGSLLYPFLSLAVGLILFESGLHFRMQDVRDAGNVVRHLITVGLIATWGMVAAAAFYILHMDLSMSILIGALLVVTGPSVVVPLLRHVRPLGRVGAIGKWEGMFNDPIGAILAVLVLKTVVFLNEPIVGGLEVSSMSEAFVHAGLGLLLILFVSIGVSVTSTGLLYLLLQKRLVPDYLKNAVALTVVVGAFAISEVLREESGLLTTAMLGIAIANLRFGSVPRFSHFKADVRVLLLAIVFILFGARLDITELSYINQNTLLFLAILLFAIRPLAVLISAIGSRINWRELIFLSWMAPRGIVAAALAALFSFQLEEIFPESSSGLVPVVFMVVIGTVAIYGLTATPLARLLKLAHPNPQGALFIGAQSWVRRMAKVLQEQGFKVMLIDSDPRNVAHAQQAGLDARMAHVLSKDVIDELELSEMGRMLVMTPNEEINALATLNFHEYFDSSEVYQLPVRPRDDFRQTNEYIEHIRGRQLFGDNVTFASLNTRFISGASIKTGMLSEEFTYDDFQMRYGKNAIPLFVMRPSGILHVFTADDTPEPQPGDTLIALINRVDRVAGESDGMMALTEPTPASEND
ncbi:MAG: cation:proton antiporter [Rhodothermales bacterium]